MTERAIPETLGAWASKDAPADDKLRSFVQLYAAALGCERCIIYCRQPELRRATTTHATWSEGNPDYAVTWPSWFSDEWVDEGPPNAEDPLYHEALVNPAAMYIDDIFHDTTGLVNIEFEAPTFKHTGLIHAPIWFDGKCYGILEPSRFGPVRHWDDRDRAITEWAQAQLGPLVAAYVAEHAPKAA